MRAKFSALPTPRPPATMIEASSRLMMPAFSVDHVDHLGQQAAGSELRPAAARPRALPALLRGRTRWAARWRPPGWWSPASRRSRCRRSRDGSRRSAPSRTSSPVTSTSRPAPRRAAQRGGHVAAVGRARAEDQRRVGRLDGGHGGVDERAGTEHAQPRGSRRRRSGRRRSGRQRRQRARRRRR